MSLKVIGEVNIGTDPCLLAWDDQLYVGCEDGSIKTFDASMNAGASWTAHEVQIFALEAGGGRVYSASYENAIRVWSPKGVKLLELSGPGGDVSALRLDGEHLYAGDDLGGVVVYEKDEVKARYSVLEEVKDILVSRPYMMTVRDLDLTITEIKPDTSRLKFMTRHTMEGRAPVKLAGSKLLLVSRDGKSIMVHDNSVETNYKLLHEQKASVMIITSLAVCNGGKVAWSGGWDGRLRRWAVGDVIAAAGELEFGACINALVASNESDVVYVAVAGGKIVKVKSVD